MKKGDYLDTTEYIAIRTSRHEVFARLFATSSLFEANSVALNFDFVILRFAWN
jgi:hypothetical protein